LGVHFMQRESNESAVKSKTAPATITAIAIVKAIATTAKC